MGQNVTVFKIDDRTIEFAGRTRRHPGTVRDFTVIGNRVLVFYDMPEAEGCGRQGLTAWPFREDTCTVLGSVEAGVRLSLLADTDNGFITPSGARVDTLAAVRFIHQFPPGCVVEVDEMAVTERNIFMYANDGTLLWRIGHNPFGPVQRFSHTILRDKKVYAASELRMGWWQEFEIDLDTGRIVAVRQD